MKVIDFFESDEKEHWLAQIEKSDWSAGRFLYKLIRDEELKSATGQSTKLLLLVDEAELISFCTYAEKDDIQPTDLTPWMGFVYTFPQHRGHHYAGLLFEKITEIAKRDKVQKVYISTNHTGLYEKYGCEFECMMTDMSGEPSRVYVKRIL